MALISILEPGETAELVIDLNNSGSGDATDLIMHPVTGDSLIEILSQPVLSADTLRGFLSQEVRFLVKGARNALPGSRSNVLLSVESKQLGVQHFPFSVMVGKIPVGICNLTGNSTSAAVMDTILDNLQVAHRMLDSIPTDPSDNGSLFVILGNSPSGAYTLSDLDDKSLSTYLLKGGNLYLESYYAQWLSGLNKNLYKKLHYAYEFGPVYTEDQLFGIGGTFTDSMHFECQTSFPYNVYNFIPKSPAYGIFRNGDTAVRMLQIVYDGEDYKTIASEVEFGLLTDSVEPSTKSTLMKRYLGIFDINLDGIYNYFHADSRDICNGGAVDFSDDSYDNIISRSWEFPGGQPGQSNEKNPVIHYPSPGEYDVRLTVTDGIHSRTVLKKSYIRVKSCSSYDPEGKIAILYPNPSTGTLHIRFLSGMGDNFTFATI